MTLQSVTGPITKTPDKPTPLIHCGPVLCLPLQPSSMAEFAKCSYSLGNTTHSVAMDGLHDESNWPKDIGIVETEERRRLVRCTTQRETSANQSAVLVNVYLGSQFVHRHTNSFLAELLPSLTPAVMTLLQAY